MLHNLTYPTTSLVEIKSVPLMNKLPSILLIDDDDIFIFLTKKMLMNTGMVNNVNVCRSATEAVRFLEFIDDENKIPDMIFLDLNMPGMNGWQFLESYQAILPKMKKTPLLYVVSSSVAENDCKKAMNIHGVNGYMAKPLQAVQLKALFQQTYS
jgi:CheY-like chemotaxis protein